MKSYIFKIRRFDPERGLEGWDEFPLDMEPSERVLDGLIRIKEELDGSLTFRRSCAHGICGSCAMQINGKNRLACQTLMSDLPGKVVLEPLPAFPVIKDLAVEMDAFFRNSEEVLPWLINREEPPERERLQSPHEQERILQAITCIMCGSCTSSCPIYQADRDYLGPAALLKSFRFISDSRDSAEAERLQRISGERGLWRCHSVFNCVEVCPKEIDITAHITKLKRLAIKRRFRRDG